MFKFKRIQSEHLTHSQLAELNEVSIYERFWIGVGVLLVILLAILDLIEDMGNETGNWYLIVDLSYVFLMLWLLFYLWRNVPITLKQTNLALTSQIVQHHHDMQAWKQKAADTMKGFGQLISVQFEEWQLTKAEQEVALLLLKGLSIKEISVVRGTSPGTTRQQATALYEKANLNSRAELSAFFLEDVLLVSPENDEGRNKPSSATDT